MPNTRNQTFSLPEAEKERRLQEMRQRFEANTDKREVTPWLPRIVIGLGIVTIALWAMLIIQYG